jgi:hypothetical protein
MRIVKYLVLSALLSIASFIGWFSLTSVLRIKPSLYKGKSINDIAGKDTDDITLEDLQGMNKDQLIEIFHQLTAPEFKEMHGEFKATILNCGDVIRGIIADVFLNRLWGKWLTKSFEPIGETHGHGYNSFLVSQDKTDENVVLAIINWIYRSIKSLSGVEGHDKIVRIMRMKTRIGDSIYDARKSFHLEYHDYNLFPTSTMKDEVRKLNDNLYLGLGILTVTLGKKNIFPFVLIGPPEKWVGPDNGY